MKTVISTLAILCIAFSSFAQISLSSTTMPAGTAVAGTKDSTKMCTTTSTYPSLAPATSAAWNLSGVTYTAANDVIYHTAISGSASYPSAQYFDSTNYATSAGPFQAVGNVMNSISASGIIAYGAHVNYRADSIGVGDTLFTLNQNVVYTANDMVVPFPATMGANWSNSYNYVTNFEITYPSLLLNHTSAALHAIVTDFDTVVGWGTMKVKTPSGGTSGSINVLQVKTVRKEIDSFFIGGTPASALVLSAFSLSQGQVTKTCTQRYYRVQQVTPLALVTFTDSTYSTVSSCQVHTQSLPLGVNDVQYADNIKVYPNPVTNNTISIEVPEATDGSWSYELIDITGKIIAAEPLALGAGQSHTQITLSHTPAVGIYYLRLKNNGEQVSVKPLSIEN